MPVIEVEELRYGRIKYQVTALVWPNLWLRYARTWHGAIRLVEEFGRRLEARGVRVIGIGVYLARPPATWTPSTPLPGGREAPIRGGPGQPYPPGMLEEKE
ncbi:MAG: hypothetical protein HYS89_00815 [Candidatus Colwellbacteria bacterium]|nr:hypothetical protein [Candidatus Colwellbacteria bacterium]